MRSSTATDANILYGAYKHTPHSTDTSFQIGWNYHTSYVRVGTDINGSANRIDFNTTNITTIGTLYYISIQYNTKTMYYENNTKSIVKSSTVTLNDNLNNPFIYILGTTSGWYLAGNVVSSFTALSTGNTTIRNLSNVSNTIYGTAYDLYQNVAYVEPDNDIKVFIF